jgi:hypothetical protein
MSRTKVITTMSQEYWDKVGQYSVSTWPALMQKDWQLWFHDTPNLPITYHVNFSSPAKYEWWKSAEEMDSRFTKKQKPYGYQKEWKTFSHKSFAQWESYEKEPAGLMVWCDADVKWKVSPTTDLLLKCLDGKFCAFMGRDRVNPAEQKKRKYKKLPNETGILIYNLDHPVAETFFKNFKNVYLSLKLFDGYDWSDCGAFETAMIETDKKYFNDLTLSQPPAINPLPLTILGNYFEHWMGWRNKEAQADLSGNREKEKIMKVGKK